MGPIGLHNALTALDYAIIAATLLISFAIGLFYAYKNKNNDSEEEYFVGGRKIPVLAAAASLIITGVSGSSVVSIPNDAYFRGPGLWFGIILVNVIESIVLPLFIVPVYHRLKLTSIYDYLSLRFDSKVKYVAVTIHVIHLFFLMGIGVYVPSLAVSAITGISINLSVILIGGIVVVYTAIGGVRAVVWSDVFQAVVITFGLGVFFAIAIPAAGGLDNILQISRETGRELSVDFTFDLKRTYTFWSALFGFVLNALTRSATSQSNAQRYLLVKTVSGARITASIGQMFTIVYYCSFVFAGLVMYAYYVNCDPFTIGIIEKQDQLFPLFLTEIFKDYPGFIGLMVAVILSASLSTVSSGINSLAVLIHTEVAKLFLKNPTPKQSITFVKVLTFVIGCLVLVSAYLSQLVEGVVDAVLTWAGILGGPILGAFLIGMCSKRVNSTGVAVGMVCATIAGVWLKLGNTFYPRAPYLKLPLFTDGCESAVTEYMVTTTAEIDNAEDEDIPSSIYQISSLYYSTVACLVVWIVSSLVSLWTGPVDGTKMNPDLFIHFGEKQQEVEQDGKTEVVAKSFDNKSFVKDGELA